MMIKLAKDLQQTPLFSLNRMLSFCVWGTLLRGAFAFGVFAVFLRDQRIASLLMLSLLLAMLLLRDVKLYYSARYKHESLSRQFGEEYEEILAAALAASSLEALIRDDWLQIELELEKRLGARVVYN